ncbi:MAG TPA: lytic transglycosylase domain-containing protein [Firmicutes bacterium]|nr:lytic transglycosylase domain-containing protein [Bacillota bacterium]
MTGKLRRRKESAGPAGRPRRIGWRLEMLLLALLLAAGTLLLRAGYRRYMQAAYPLEYSEYVEKYAEYYSFEPAFLYALIRTESEFDPGAVSRAGAMGLMQLTEDTFLWAQSRSPEAEDLPADELFDPETNIRYGTMVLSLLREEFGDTRTLLAAYNAGIGNVRKWLADPACSDDGETLRDIPFPETAGYVEKIPAAAEMYRELYGL